MPLLAEPPSAIAKRHRTLEKKAHDTFLGEAAWNSENAVVTIHPEARLIQIASPVLWSEHERPEQKRGAISYFTPSSRMRQMCALARVKRNAPLPVFLTLTYPSQWPSDWEEWKEHLEKFMDAVESKYPDAASMWKLEPQQRDAPHFHALTWNVRRIPWQWVAVQWACTVHNLDARKYRDFPSKGGGKIAASRFREWVEQQNFESVVADSFNAGTSIEKVDSWHGVAYYAAKYLGKVCSHFENGGGRFWGIKNRKMMPFSKVEEIHVSLRVAVMLKRLARRFMESKGYRACKGWRIKLITDDMANWLRAASMCCDWSQAPPVLQPF